MTSITIKKELLFIIAAGIIAVYVLRKIKAARHNNEKLFDFKEYMRLAMFLYVIALVGVTLFPIVIPPYAEPYQMDFVNWDMRNMFNYGGLRSLLANVCGNILLFVPLVPLVELNWPNKQVTLVKTMILSLSVSAMIEALQYLENIFAISDFPIRITDISDLVLNFIGGMLGYGLIEFWKKSFWRKK